MKTILTPKFLYVLTAVTLLNWVGWQLLPDSRSQEQATSFGKIMGVSYSPFRMGHNPVTGVFPTPAEIEEDMVVLKDRVEAIRTYGSANLEFVAPIAARHNLMVNAGAWLDSDFAKNEVEMAAMIRVARENLNVSAVMVGNEAILRANLAPAEVSNFAKRQELSVEKMIQYLRRVKKALPDVPVSTAEPWHIWVKYPQLADHCDYIAIHLLPYWEGVPIEQGIAQVRLTYNIVREKFPDKQIMIGEVGWPSGGEFFGGSVPSQWNQEIFIREFLSQVRTLDPKQKGETEYFVMEGFDQPWKLEEGIVGKTWGLFNDDRTPKFEWTQPSYAGVPLAWQWGASALLGLAMMVWLRLIRPALKWEGQLFLGLVVQVGLSLLVYTGLMLTMPWLTTTGKVIGLVLLPLQVFMIAILIIQSLEMAEILWRERWQRLFPAVPLATPRTHFPKVSIHVACCNEPPAMMVQTLEALGRLKYPNFEVIVVDNNTKDERVWRPVEQACAILGQRFKFFHLESWPGYKAGALNYALEQTDPQAQIVGVIDADYTVSPEWLNAVVPHFDDPKVGLVQCPQDNRGWRRNPFKEMINWEYAGFFFLGMPHRNEEDAIIQHGTMCLVRRSIMQELGGWATWCICEDSELGLRLMQKGYRTAYVNDVLGQGLVPDDFAAYKKQRSRWAYGAIQILRRHVGSVFSMRRHREGRNLTPAQRYHFIAGWLPWVGDALHLLFTLLLLGGTAMMILFPRYFMMPAAAFFLPVLLITPFNILRSIWLYQRRVPCTVRQGLAACIAGLGLTYTIGRSCLYSMVSTRRPFGRTPKCQSNSALTRCLAMARDEMVLMLALWGSLVGLAASRPHLNNTQTVVWLACLALQSLPYLAAVICAVVNSLPAINTAAASFGQRRAAVLARRAKAVPTLSPLPQPVPVPVSATATATANAG